MTAARPGFLTGARSLVDAFGYLVNTPRAWPLALVPPAMLLALIALTSSTALALLPTAADTIGFAPTSMVGRVGAGVLDTVGRVVVVLGCVLGSVLLTAPLSAPALESLVAHRERDLDVPPRAPSSFVSELWCGLRAQFSALLFATPLFALLWVAAALFPPAAIVVVPIEVLLTSSMVAWNLLDYPLTLRGVRIRKRLGMARRHLGAVAGFGGAFAVLFWIPCGGILLLSVGVLAATRLIWQLADADPVLASALRDPEPRPEAGG